MSFMDEGSAVFLARPQKLSLGLMKKENDMRFGPFLGLAILLVILWAGGFVFFHVAGFLIHLLLIFAVISLIIHLFSGSARTA
jgi:hypothetical protein